MNNLLLLKAFEKAEEKFETNVTTRLSTLLSDFVLEDSGEPYGEKSLRTKYNALKENSSERINLRGYVQEALSHFLGYDDFAHFIKENSEDGLSFIGRVSRKKIVIAIGISLMILIVVIISGINTQRWMVWQNDHYVEVKFDLEKYEVNQLKFYKQERIDNFKKITPDCNTEFFKADGSENLWYGKNAKGELEYFTDLGLHPETGKTLKKITTYMIRKYICEGY